MSIEVRFYVDKETSEKIKELQESLKFSTRGKLFEHLLNVKFESIKEGKEKNV
jgi:hypothetical protein